MKKSGPGAMIPVYTFGRYLRERFGLRVRKLPVSLSGLTCPNIDGTVARGGCTFCLNESFSPNFVEKREKIFLNLESRENPILKRQMKELQRQIKDTGMLMKAEGTEKFLIYFQSFTNTYAPFDTLRSLYELALSFEGVVGLSIGTRSDCVEDRTLEYLAGLSGKYEIWIEFGIQSVYDETLRRINRGHDSMNVYHAIKKAKDAGLKVCGHLIFGLPGENKDMMLESARRSYEWGIDSVKYHPLYVVRNTILANEYRQGKFTPIGFEDYVDVLRQALLDKPGHISVQRITAGTGDDTLLAPSWCGWSKNTVLHRIRQALMAGGISYG